MINKFLTTLILVLMVSCENTQSPQEKLTNNDWEVISISSSVNLSKTPWMHFDINENRVNGNAGCNNFFGNIEITDSTITFGMLGATKMMCPDMAIENLLFSNLEKVTKYKFVKDSIHFLSENDVVIMILQTKKN